MYFMPASFASFTHSSALYLTGLNCDASFSYSRTGHRRAEHDPLADGRAIRLPCHSPAGNRVETPMDEQAVLRLAEPLEALFRLPDRASPPVRPVSRSGHGSWNHEAARRSARTIRTQPRRTCQFPCGP